MTCPTTPRAGRLVTVGETMALAASLTPGALEHAPALGLGIGGSESNVAIGVRRLGGRARWAGRVGDDPFGRRVARELRAEDVEMRAIVDDGAPTGFMVKEHRTADATHVWYYRRGSAGSRLCVDDVSGDLLDDAGVLHLTGITPGLSESAHQAVTDLVDRATAAGVPVSFDVNHRAAVWAGRDPGPVYRRFAERSAVVFAGPVEARLLTGDATDDPAELVAAMADITGRDAVLKLGADGCVAVVDGSFLVQPAVPVTVVDTVGAGDAFVAGYLADLLLGRTGVQRLLTAARCGALVCSVPGDWEGLPTRADLAGPEGGDPVTR